MSSSHNLWHMSVHGKKEYCEFCDDDFDVTSTDKKFIAVEETSRVFMPGRICPFDVAIVAIALCAVVFMLWFGYNFGNAPTRIFLKISVAILIISQVVIYGFIVGQKLKSIYTDAFVTVTKKVYKEVTNGSTK